MHITRRQLLKTAALAPFAAAFSNAFAQGYPSKPVKILIPAGAGTGIDAIGRYFTEPLTEIFGQPFVIDNRPGAGGLIGYREAANSPADGYTLILTGIPLYLLPLLSESSPPPFHSKNDFTPVARVNRVPNAIVVAADSPYKTLQDLMKAMEDDPEEITFSSQGVGSTANFCGLALNETTNTKGKHIPYKETSMAITDVVAGRIDFTCQSSPATLPLIQGGRLRALAVTSKERWKSLPDVPTAQEQGLEGFEFGSQLDFMAPAGTPDDVLQRLSDAFHQITERPEYADFCLRQAIVPEYLDYQSLRPEVDRELARWTRMVELSRA